ncbi:MAG: translational GTPase TypA [Candidatus Paceibacterota bacterium]|jgi:GTP-binding protein|nr:translational GTPase TypA [Candidatus Paceibacterota bacterium]
MEIRNIAIIAHVDHGKTSLTDALLRQSGVGGEEVSMDMNDLERERGITIYSKNASINYKDTKINLVDTPGHADFSSEVERVLRSIDCVLLLVDAADGPMPQTRFVLKKALQLGLKPIVVINKIDKPAARPDWVQDEIFALFMDLGASDEQIDFPVVYTIAKNGIAKLNLTDESNDLSPLIETILKKVPVASSDELNKKPFKFQSFNLGYDDFLGRLAIGRIYQGTIKPETNVFIKTQNSSDVKPGKVIKIFNFEGLERKEIEEAQAGDIVMLAGLTDIDIGQTVCVDPKEEPMTAITVDEPTISLNLFVNSSPLSGRDGKFFTSRQIKDRLQKELEINVGLKIDFSSNEDFKIFGRGELHLAILLENMRREGYEMQVSQPQVVFKKEDGVTLEPFEEITVDVPTEMMGAVIEKMAKRKGIATDIKTEESHTKIIFEIPTRGFLGYRGEFVVDTRGEGTLCSQFVGFRPYVGEIEHHTVGSMVSMATGKALTYALGGLQERGTLYIGPSEDIYEGMVIGNVSRGNDLLVNPTKGKVLTHVRSKGADEAIVLMPRINLTLEKGLEIMNEDEYLEITPKIVRLRKKILTDVDRIRDKRLKNQK